jgi:glycosyltransferase involved in cell wall biosynthesis
VCWPGALFRRSYFYLHDSHKLEGFKGRGICTLISLLVTRILVITESRVAKLAGIGVTNTRYFPNCVSTKTRPFEQQETAEKNPGHPVYKAVSVGQITAWKRIDKSIMLIDRLNQLGLPIELEIFGRPDPLSPADIEYFRRIQEMCSASGFSSLRGYTEDLAGLYRKADLFISMSVNEPFGLSLVEALSFGVPAIAMEGEGPDEILSADVGLLLLEGFECDDDLVDRVKHVISIRPMKCKERAGLYSYEIYRERVRCEFECSV